MELDELDELHRYWQRNPPMGLLLMACAKVLGIKMPEPIDRSRHMTREEAMRFFQRTGGKVTASMLGISGP